VSENVGRSSDILASLDSCGQAFEELGMYGFSTRLETSSSEEEMDSNASMISRTLDMTVGLTFGDTMQS
jgi:hypothetical protein